MDVKLVMFKTNGQKKEIALSKASTTIGRGAECDIRIPLDSCSRKHCELNLSGDSLQVRDLGSSNGTYVNNERVTEQSLSAGDRLTIGPVVLTIQINGEPADVSTPEPHESPRAIDENEELISTSGSGETSDVDALMAAVGPESSDSEEDPISALEALADLQDDD